MKQEIKEYFDATEYGNAYLLTVDMPRHCVMFFGFCLLVFFHIYRFCLAVDTLDFGIGFDGAVELASFRISIDSMSSGFIEDNELV